MLELIVIYLFFADPLPEGQPILQTDSIIYCSDDIPIADSSTINSIETDLFNRDIIIKLEERVANREAVIILLLLLLFLMQSCFVLSVAVGRSVKKRRRLQSENKQLSSDLKTLTESVSEKLKLTSYEGMHFFNALSQVYWQNQPEKVVSTLQRILENLVSDDKVINEMIEMLNKTRDNIVIRLTESVPSLSSRDILLFCYLTIQLDHNAICMILDKTPGALNANIYRLRKKISESNSHWKGEFIDAIA